MNTASQNLPHHLGILRERMLHPTDYEKAVYYFLGLFFEETDTGVAMIVPGMRGQAEMARFHVTGGLAHPERN